MIFSYKVCISILLEPVHVDIKTTQTKDKTVGKYLNDKNSIHFFLFSIGRWVNGFFPIFPQDFFCSIVLYTVIYK